MYQRTCKTCGDAFVIPSGFRGRFPVHCGKECRVSHQLSLRAARETNGPECSIAGCVRRVRSHKGPVLCDTCYIRIYRGGQSDLPKRKGRHQTSNGYLVLLRPDHPLARVRDGLVMEHRLVLYNAIGPGPHACEWCGKETAWVDAHVDHLDRNRRNNIRQNLLFSCAACNQQRGITLDFLSRLTAEGRARFAACKGDLAIEFAQKRTA